MSIKNYINPYILEERSLNVASVDIMSRLLSDRIIFLFDEIDSNVSSVVQAQLMYLSSISNEDIHMYINSPGGEVDSGLAIYDTMRIIKPKVHTFCTGLCASMASLLLAAGDKRTILEHSKVMIHQPMGWAGGKTTDVVIMAKELEKARTELATIYSKHTRKDVSEILKDIENDNWMNAKEALTYGLVDDIKYGKQK